MGDEGKKDINPTISLEGSGKDAVISVRPARINITGQKPESALGEPEDVLRIGQTKQNIRTATLLEQAWSLIRYTASKVKDGEALVDEEIEAFTDITDRLTQKGKDGGRALRLDMAGMIVHVDDLDKKTAAQNWKDLSDPKKAEAVRVKNFEMGLLFNYIKEFNGDPEKLDWAIVVAYGQALVEGYQKGPQIKKETLKALVDASIRDPKGREEFYQKLLIREGYADAIKTGKGDRKWRDWQEREKAFDVLLGVRQPEATVDPVKFLERQFYELAVRPRLEAMRAPTVTRLAKDGKRMEIVQSWWEKHVKRARLASRLSFEVLNPSSELGKYLNDLGELDFWRGKAAIDRMWSLYTGIPIESGEVRQARAAGEGLFSVLTKDNVNAAEVSECCGPGAELQISKDGKVCDAINILYHLAEGKTYKESLEELKVFFKQKHKTDIDFNKELPGFVKDAVMIAYFYGLDIRANGNKDARYKSWLVGEFESIGWVTDVNGNRINLLGDAFALKPDDMVERGWYSGRNASLAFNAITGGSEIYDPKEQSHRTEKWQSVFFYALGLDRDNKRVRHYDVDPNVPDDNILPGTMGKFEKFYNKNKDHRRALFDRLVEVAKQDLNESKPYWDDDLRARVGRVLNFFTNADPNQPVNPFGTNNEIWFDSTTMSGLSIWQDLNLVLEDPKAWGLIGDFRDPEMQDRTQNTRYTQHNSLMYDCAAVESAGFLVEILKKIPNTLPEEMGVFPAQILEAGLKMRHRYNSELTFRNLETLLITTSQQAIEMFLQVQIPSREMVQKMLGEYKLFEWKRIFEGVKGLPVNGTIQRSAGIEFFLRQIEQELDITETGIVGRFDDAIMMMVNILVLTEAFDWGTQRDLFMNKRAFVYQYLSSWLNPRRPVEGHRVPVAITQADGSIKIRQLCVSDLTYREVFGWTEGDKEYEKYLVNRKKKMAEKDIKASEAMKTKPPEELPEFFTPMTKAEIGQAYGGSLAAKISVPVAGFAAGNTVDILGQSGNQRVVYGKNTAGEVVRETIDVSQLTIISHEVNGWQRPGETILEGGRAVYKKGNWEWVKGRWEFQREAGMRFKFVAGEGGYSRVWDEIRGGNPAENHEAWIKKAVVEETKEVRLPCLKMTEEQAQKFFLHRYQILFDLLTGRAHEGEGNKPGQAAIDLDSYYENSSAFISKLIRPVKDLEFAVNMVQMKQALRGIVMKGEHLSYEFIAVNKWAKEAYAIAKGKEVEGNIEHGQEKQIIEAADAIRKEELNALNLHWLGKTVLWANENLVWKKINTPAVVVTGLALWGVDFAAGTSVMPLLSNLMRVVNVPVIWSTLLPYVAVTIPTYILSLRWWDKGPMLSIVRKINNLKAPNFGDFFSKYFDPSKNIEDAYFPAQ